MKGITFSSDTGEYDRKDMDTSADLAEQYFHMEENHDQIPATKENIDWIYNNIRECDNLIRYNGKIIGFAFIIPSNKNIMQEFISGEISERELFEETKKMKLYEDVDAIYLCSSFTMPEFRGKGLSTEAIIKAIKKLMEKMNRKPVLFFWKFTEEGERLARKSAEMLGLELYERKD